MKATISLCIIAKNEADLISQCIISALPYVDQVVVVDTGSSDRTQEIARSLGAEVWEFPWKNDFSVARNYSLEKARGDWILFMDCDEEVDQSTGEKLLSAVQSKDYDAFYINIKNIVSGGNQVAFHSIRLFRNLPQFRFQGKIHEQISFSILKHSRQERIGRTSFTLLHHGYNPEKVNIQAKIARNVQLLKEQQGNTDNQDGFFLYNMGIEHVRQGHFQEALENFIQSLKVTKSAVGYAPSLVNKIIICLIELKRYRDALEQLSYFQSVYPNYSDLYLLEAACHIRCGRYSLADESIKKAQSVSSNDLKYPVEGIIFGQRPEVLLNSFKNFLFSKLKKIKLSVCILANNEENNIARCLQSIGELADEILLITTGCSDNTLNIAYQMGANLYRLNWENSFAKLRNFVLKQATGDWVMFLNGDEELNQTDIPTVAKHLNDSSQVGHLIRIRRFYNPGNWSLYQEQAVLRIVRNKKDLHYRSSLLEDIEQSVRNKYGDDSINSLPITIFDYRSILKPHLQEANFQRNISLISEDFKIFGESSLLHEAMGYEYLKMNKFSEALSHFEQAIQIAESKVPALLWYHTINCLFKLGKFTEALKYANSATSIYHDYTDIVYVQGCCYLRLGYLEDALKCFNCCLELGDASWEKYLVQPGVGSYLAHSGLAEVYIKQGDINSGLEQYKIASSYPEGISFAIPPLTLLIIKQFGSGMILNYLKDNNLDSCQHLCTAAKSTNKYGCLMESLELWQAAIEKFKQSNDPGQYQLIYSSMFQFLGNIYSNAIKCNPDDPRLQSVASFFK